MDFETLRGRLRGTLIASYEPDFGSAVDALTWNGRVSFNLTTSLQLKKISFLDGVFEGRVADGDEGFDANAAIATGELAPMIGELIDALGGEQVFGEAPAPVAPAGPAPAPAANSTDLPPWEAAA